MKIILAGGGTLGSVSPLIAVWQELKSQSVKTDTLFVGTSSGPEKGFLKQYPEIKFIALAQAKWRRYFSLLNLLTPWSLLLALIQSFFIMLSFKPDLIISAGGFIAVPINWLGKLFGAKIVIHQLDLRPTLSNKLTKKQADLITVTFKKSVNDFPRQKTVLVGPLLRQEVLGFKQKVLTGIKMILVLGGGTGSLSLNKTVVQAMPLLAKNLRVVLVTGQGKRPTDKVIPNYTQVEFLAADYYQKINEAAVVISRAGLSTLLELAYLAKPTIIVPLPESHQEANAEYYEKNRAALNLRQPGLTAELLAKKINFLSSDPPALKQLSENIKMMAPANGAGKMAELIINLLKHGFSENQ